MGFPGATKMGTTGGAFAIDEETREKIGRVKASGKEVFVGFGIKDRKDVELAFQYADGAIIGTRAVSELERGKELCFRMKYDPFLCFYSLKKG